MLISWELFCYFRGPNGSSDPSYISALYVWNESQLIAGGGGGGSANESQGSTAIETASNNTLTSPLKVSEQQVTVRDASDTQTLATWDWYVEKDSQVWLFNYITDNETETNLSSIGTTINIWENESLSTSDIQTQIEAFINATKN